MISGHEAVRLPSGDVLGLPPILAQVYDWLAPEPTDLPSPPGLGTMVSLPLRKNVRHGLRWLIEQEARRGDQGPVSVAREFLARSGREGSRAGGARRYHSTEPGPIRDQKTWQNLLSPEGVLRYPLRVLHDLQRLFQQGEPFAGSVNRFRGAVSKTEAAEGLERAAADQIQQWLSSSVIPREEAGHMAQALMERVRQAPLPWHPPAITTAELDALLKPPTGPGKLLAPIEKITLGGGAYPR